MKRSIPPSANREQGVRALVWIDMEPLLAAERGKCEKATRDLYRVRQSLETFRTEWQPAFSRWFHGKFGKRVTEARDLAAKAAELGRLVTSVEAEAYLSGCSEKKAYVRIERMRQGAEKIEEMRSERQREESSGGPETEKSFSDKSDDEIPPEVEEFLKMGFEQMFGRNRFSPKEYARMFESFKQSFREDVLGKKRTSGEEQAHQAGNRRGSRSVPPMRQRKLTAQESSDELRRKQLYRDLARKLHPDLNRELNAQEQDLWHEVRAAYESKNLEALETLAAMLESGGAVGFAKVRSVSRLRAIFLEAQKKLRAAQRAVREAKKEPSWNFSVVEGDPGRLKDLDRRIARELNVDIRDFAAEIAQYECKIERWKSAPQSRRKRGHNPVAKTFQDDLPF